MECPICQQGYNFISVKPFNLDCGHSFCFTCIQLLSESKIQMICPSCRKINNTAIQDLNPNYGLLTILESESLKQLQLLKVKDYKCVCKLHYNLEIEYFCKLH